MNKQRIAAALLAIRKQHPTMYCWLEPEDNAEAKKATMQKANPTRDIVTIRWAEY